MLTFTRFLLQEHFHNLIGDHPDKEKHKQEVFDMVQKAYEPIGGIHGSGFNDPDDMAKKIPFWKIKKKDGKIKAVALYKDKGGRKRVAVATDGSREGKGHLANIMHDDVKRHRAYAEQSGSSLSFLKKQLPEGHLKKIALHHDEVKRLMPDDEIDTHVQHDDPEVQAHPELKDHFYRRKIGDEWHTKISLGTPGNKIES
jgi:hypothetical protein